MDMDFLLHGVTLRLVTSFAEECIRSEKRLFSSTLETTCHGKGVPNEPKFRPEKLSKTI